MYMHVNELSRIMPVPSQTVDRPAHLQNLLQAVSTAAAVTDVKSANMAHSDNILAINYQIDSSNAL